MFLFRRSLRQNYPLMINRRWYSNNVDDFELHCVETLESLNDKFDEILEPLDKLYDVSLSNNVLTVSIQGHGTYVINKQGVNKQIWVSSPFSGPSRFDLIDGRWIYKRSGMSLHQLLSQEMSKNVLQGRVLDFDTCYFGGKGQSTK